MLDPRIVANRILDEAEQRGQSLTNLSLQKLVYFAHGVALTRHNKQLVSGYFEAWQFGPVHPVLYREFKSAGKGPICKRAPTIDALTGLHKCPAKSDEMLLDNVVMSLFNGFAKLSASRLVEISHAPGGPWDRVVDKSRTSIAFNPRISDELIKQYFRFHLVSINVPNDKEIELEDKPIA